MLAGDVSDEGCHQPIAGVMQVAIIFRHEVQRRARAEGSGTRNLQNTNLGRFRASVIGIGGAYIHNPSHIVLSFEYKLPIMDPQDNPICKRDPEEVGIVAARLLLGGSIFALARLTGVIACLGGPSAASGLAWLAKSCSILSFDILKTNCW
ncbi:type I iterative PKS [Apiospora phragmitis]|uniref:Type I iterative PKS n=1 Tax=Apiospora phragmitis TaxID=2905665 RepID=A0ABR1VFD8_9PEZI